MTDRWDVLKLLSDGLKNRESAVMLSVLENREHGEDAHQGEPRKAQRRRSQTSRCLRVA